MTLGMQLHKINVDQITADYDTVGKLQTKKLKIEINNIFRLGLPIINKLVSAHVMQIPTHIGKHVELSDVVIAYYDNYLALGVTPTIVKTTEADLVFI